MKLATITILIFAFGVLIILAASCTAPEGVAQSAMANDELTADLPAREKRTPVLVELFTSEGCSSCPSADKTLELLVREQPFVNAEIIALSEHVDYWNRLGWNDPFSAAEFSQRQSEYSEFFGKNGDVYTPQMIVDGSREFVGSNMREAQKAITEAARTNKADVLLTTKSAKDEVSITIRIEDLPQTFESAIVLLAITEDNLASSVSRGENAGSKLTHVAVARSLINVGIMNAGQKSFAASPAVKLHRSWKTENLSVVVFIQDLKTRQVLGVAKISLNSRSE